MKVRLGGEKQRKETNFSKGKFSLLILGGGGRVQGKKQRILKNASLSRNFRFPDIS